MRNFFNEIYYSYVLKKIEIFETIILHFLINIFKNANKNYN